MGQVLYFYLVFWSMVPMNGKDEILFYISLQFSPLPWICTYLLLLSLPTTSSHKNVKNWWAVIELQWCHWGLAQAIWSSTAHAQNSVFEDIVSPLSTALWSSWSAVILGRLINEHEHFWVRNIGGYPIYSSVLLITASLGLGIARTDEDISEIHVFSQIQMPPFHPRCEWVTRITNRND